MADVVRVTDVAAVPGVPGGAGVPAGALPPRVARGAAAGALARGQGVRTVLAALSAVTMLGALAGALLYAPTERVQGDVQRIFYIHVPAAWVAFLAFFVVFVSGIGYLWKRSARWDVLGRASAEVGVLFTTLVLITGSLWARPIWGTWWSWDARLTTTLVLWLVYVAYLMVRAYAGDSERGARYAAVLGIVGFLDVPIVHQSVVWWRTLHPGPTVVQDGRSPMPPAMVEVLLLSLVAFTVLYVYLLLEKMAIERAKDALARHALTPN